MEQLDLVRALVSVVIAYAVLFPSAVLYRYRRLSKRRAMVAGGMGGCLLSVIAFLPHFDPLVPSLAAMVVATASGALAMRYVVILLDRILRRA